MAEAESKKPALIIEIAGGLGNQMFQYAFYLKLNAMGYSCKLYYDKTQQKHNGYELEKAFGIEEHFASKEELERIMDEEKSLLSRIRREIAGHKPSVYWEHDKGYAFKPEILIQPRSVYLQGCWLSEKYFVDIESCVRAAFAFTEPDAKNKALFSEIVAKKNTVSIHIRRGDYLESAIHRNLNYEDYISESLKIIKRKVAVDTLYVFSDDADYASELMKKINTRNRTLVDFNKGNDAFRDMQLMASCHHNIIANSTFSWWAAWLNPYPGKIVVSPKDWFSTDILNKNDIVPEEWIKI